LCKFVHVSSYWQVAVRVTWLLSLEAAILVNGREYVRLSGSTRPGNMCALIGGHSSCVKYQSCINFFGGSVSSGIADLISGRSSDVKRKK
jgi:hypothetical protein